MRLVIDLQGAQGSNKNRGIGRYCLSLTRSMARLRNDHEIVVVLSSLFPDTIDPLRAALLEVLPSEAIRVLHVPDRIPDADPGCDSRRVAAELIREQFFASLNPDFVLITSLFEGLGDDVVTSIGRFSTNVPTACVLYDLIPLINSNIYLKNPVLAKWYNRKIAHLCKADLLLAISESSRHEAIDWLNFREDQVTNISTAAEDHFTPMAVTPEQCAALGRNYGLERPFVMYTGGIDHRKNIEGLIEAYAKLPQSLRKEHQLAVVCSISQEDRERLSDLAIANGLDDGELVLTGYIPEEDLLTCYRSCKLFVFPSWHEGFGLPALEAMKCGRAVIASNRSSLPEVIGTDDALFDPYDIDAMRDAMAKALEDDAFRSRLEKHGLKQAEKFGWEVTAQLAWQGLEAAHNDRISKAVAAPIRLPRMAFISPLPPENSGISDYSAELLPELARHYKIDVIVAQDCVDDVGILANHPVRSVEWFKINAHKFDRVIYHFGNSHFHSHMFDLLRDYPGMVVLHDFYLSGIVAHRDGTGEDSGGWARALFEAHGWPAVVHRFKAEDTADVVWAYPCNLDVLQNALGVIVHADFSRQLAQRFYGKSAGNDWYHIPHLRKPMGNLTKAEARKKLGFNENDFIVCSFGLLGPMKMNDQLLSSWLNSPLAADAKCHLIFVGKNSEGPYGAKILRGIRSGNPAGRIEITGWADLQSFRLWLAAADIGVQLRTLSRGETSGTVLDCMNAGLATIVNANGAMAELPKDCVWRMPDDFEERDLIEALLALHKDPKRRKSMGDRARARIASHHNPRQCGIDYANAIEDTYARSAIGAHGLEQALIENKEGLDPDDWTRVLEATVRNSPPTLRKRRLYVDISELVQRDWGSGIQRVVRSILMNWLFNPPADCIVEPVYATTSEIGYRSAREFTSKMLDIWPHWSRDEIIEPIAGDIFIGLDLQPAVVPHQQALLDQWHRMGVVVRFVIYDLLPVISPEFFFPGAKRNHHAWLETIARFDGVICISRAVADEFKEWLDHYGPKRSIPLEIDWFHLGGDKEPSKSNTKLSDSAETLLAKLVETPSFLSVATIEPRKGFRQTLDAMELLWKDGVEVNFIIVGKAGWLMDDFIDRLRNHPELNHRLFWLEGISDNYLYAVYKNCYCLIAASEGEGFGLPLIEAAHHGLPVLARDIPVFREVAGDAASYFANDRNPITLADAIRITLKSENEGPDRAQMKWLTWRESADALLTKVLKNDPPYQSWKPDGIYRFWGNDLRLKSDFGIHDGKKIRTNDQEGYLFYGPYISVDAGLWKIEAYGEADFLEGNEFIEFCSDEGQQVFWSSPLKADSNTWSVSGIGAIVKNTDGLEIRLYVSKKTKLSLEGISLTRLPLVQAHIDNRIERTR